MTSSHVYPFSKKEYMKGDRPDVECILCACAKNHKEVVNLIFLESDHCVVSINLFPYNSGHLMIFPKRHIVDLRELTHLEEMEITALTKVLMDGLDDLYSPHGFNVGYNIREVAGASINHLHQHIIPRYPNELGIVDLIGGSKVLIEDPKESQLKFKKYFKNNLLKLEKKYSLKLKVV